MIAAARPLCSLRLRSRRGPGGKTGAAVEAPALTRQGETWTVQGNTLADRAVVIEAAAVMEAAEGVHGKAIHYKAK